MLIILINDHHRHNHVIMTYYPSKLHKAVMEENYKLLLQLLSNGEDSDASGCIGSWIRGACVNKRTALHCASQRSDIRSIAILLMFGANPNCRDEDGYTPLHYVCQQYPGNVSNKQLKQSVELLLDYGADARVKTIVGQLSPIAVAIRADNNCCVQILNNYCKLIFHYLFVYLNIINMG